MRFQDHDFTQEMGGDTGMDRTFNRRLQPGEPQRTGDPQPLARSMQDLVDAIQADSVDTERSYPILLETGYFDGQLLVSVPVPFDFNSVVLSVVGGVVACTVGAVAVDGVGPSPFGGFKHVADGQTCNQFFGGMAFGVGSELSGANLAPIPMSLGPQTWRFQKRAMGQTLNFWVHPFSHLDDRYAIEGADHSKQMAQLIMVGEAQFVRS